MELELLELFGCRQMFIKNVFPTLFDLVESIICLLLCVSYSHIVKATSVFHYAPPKLVPAPSLILWGRGYITRLHSHQDQEIASKQNIWEYS